MNNLIENWLKNRLNERKMQLKEYGYDGRAYRHWNPDLDYAEWEITMHLTDGYELWDGWTDFDEITNSPLFVETVFIQACANMKGF